jgi:HSP20 family protein
MRPSVFDLDLFKVFGDIESSSLNSLKHRHDTIDDEGIKIELPGVKPEDVDVSVEGKALKVTGKSRHGKEFRYVYTLKNSTDSAKIKAEFINGLLEILLPKRVTDECVKKIVIET